MDFFFFCATGPWEDLHCQPGCPGSVCVGGGGGGDSKLALFQLTSRLILMQLILV